jgi:hypothetical protein
MSLVIPEDYYWRPSPDGRVHVCVRRISAIGFDGRLRIRWTCGACLSREWSTGLAPLGRPQNGAGFGWPLLPFPSLDVFVKDLVVRYSLHSIRNP